MVGKCLDGAQPFIDEMAHPAGPLVGIAIEGGGVVGDDTWIADRMGVHGDGMGDGAQTCRFCGVGWQQWRLRHARIKIFDDGQRLRHHLAVDRQRRHEALWIALQVLVGPMAAIQKIHRHAVMGYAF